MRYQQPFGISDLNASYINGNPATGILGSIPPAAAFEQPQREIVNVIQAGDLTPSDTDLSQLLQSNRRQKYNFGVDTGVANHIVVSLNPPLLAYHQGMPVRVLIAHDCTGPSDINIDSQGLRSIKRSDGSDTATGDMKAGMVANLIDTGTVMQLQNPLQGVASTSNTYTVDIPYVADSSATVNTVTALFSPAITTITEGKYIAVKFNNTNTGPVNIAVNALAPIPILRDDAQQLQSGDLLKNMTMLLENHSTYYQVVGLVRSQVLLAPAPKLRTFLASQFGMTGTVCPTSQWTRLSFPNVFRNTMLSTWDGTTLTINPAEAGFWLFSATAYLPKMPLDSELTGIAIMVNGTTGAYAKILSAGGFAPAGNVSAPSLSAPLFVNAGDQLGAELYQQCGSTIVTTPDYITQLSGMLLSV